jgi:hypothetical protein
MRVLRETPSLSQDRVAEGRLGRTVLPKIRRMGGREIDMTAKRGDGEAQEGAAGRLALWRTDLHTRGTTGAGGHTESDFGSQSIVTTSDRRGRPPTARLM